MTWKDESGQVAVIFAITLLGLLVVTALVIDGGVLFSARRDLQSLADGAARAGAMSLDENHLRSSGGRIVHLDPTSAQEAANEYLRGSGFSGRAEIATNLSSVSVGLREERPTLMMGIAGIKTINTSADAVAYPVIGTGEGLNE
jgi:hypothetical protein